MSERLKKIVDIVKAKSPLKNWAVAKLSIAIGQDVSQITDSFPDDPELEKKLLETAKEILKTDHIDI